MRGLVSPTLIVDEKMEEAKRWYARTCDFVDAFLAEMRSRNYPPDLQTALIREYVTRNLYVPPPTKTEWPPELLEALGRIDVGQPR